MSTEPNQYDVHVVRARVKTYSAQMMLEAAALLAGITTRRHDRRRFCAEAEHGDDVCFFLSRLASMPRSAFRAVKDKAETRRMLASQGLPVPEGRSFTTTQLDAARHYARTIGYPVVVKPASGRQGLGVTAGIADARAFDAALGAALDAGFDDGRILVERHVSGRDLRVLATGRRSLSVIERLPASVVGDGRSTIRELVERKNEARRFNPYLKSKPIELDREPALLERRGLGPTSVPPVGMTVILSSVANLSRGGDSVELSATTHPSITEAAARAVRAIEGLAYGGVDILVEDPTLPLDGQRAAVIEINGTPDIIMHPFPVFGAPVNVAAALIEAFVPNVGHAPRAPASDRLRALVRISGRVTRVGYRRWLARRANRLGVVGWVRNDGDDVEAYLEGSAPRVAMLVSAAARGPAAASVEAIRTRPLDVSEVLVPPGFAIVAR